MPDSDDDGSVCCRPVRAAQPWAANNRNGPQSDCRLGARSGQLSVPTVHSIDDYFDCSKSLPISQSLAEKETVPRSSMGSGQFSECRNWKLTLDRAQL